MSLVKKSASGGDPSQDRILHTGYLHKRGAVNTGYKKRWMVLRPNSLRYYKEEKSTSCLGDISLEGAQYGEDVEQRFGICVSPAEGKRTYRLCAENVADRSGWLRDLGLTCARRMYVQAGAGVRSPPLREGYAHKLGGEKRNWKKRYFELRANVLAYFENAPPRDASDDILRKRMPLGSVVLLGCQAKSVRPSKVDGKAHGFQIFHPQLRTYFMAAPDAVSQQGWIDAINQASDWYQKKRKEEDTAALPVKALEEGQFGTREGDLEHQEKGKWKPCFLALCHNVIWARSARAETRISWCADLEGYSVLVSDTDATPKSGNALRSRSGTVRYTFRLVHCVAPSFTLATRTAAERTTWVRAIRRSLDGIVEYQLCQAVYPSASSDSQTSVKSVDLESASVPLENQSTWNLAQDDQAEKRVVASEVTDTTPTPVQQEEEQTASHHLSAATGEEENEWDRNTTLPKESIVWKERTEMESVKVSLKVQEEDPILSEKVAVKNEGGFDFGDQGDGDESDDSYDESYDSDEEDADFELDEEEYGEFEDEDEMEEITPITWSQKEDLSPPATADSTTLSKEKILLKTATTTSHEKPEKPSTPPPQLASAVLKEQTVLDPTLRPCKPLPTAPASRKPSFLRGKPLPAPPSSTRKTETLKEKGLEQGELSETDRQDEVRARAVRQSLRRSVAARNSIQNGYVEETMKVGYLYKKGLKRRNWLRRLFVLKNTMLLYFRTPEDDQPLGVIHLKHAMLGNCTIRDFSFALNKPGRTHFLAAASEEEQRNWTAALCKCIGRCLEVKSLAMKVKKKGAYRRVTTVPSSQLQKSGILKKKGGRRKNWNARHFELRLGALSYQKEKNDGKILGVIDLHEIGIDDSSRRPYGWSISTPTRTFHLEANSLQDKVEWIAAIENNRT